MEERRFQAIYSKKITKRQKEVLLLFLKGESDKQIHKFLGITEETVRKHISNICKKFELKTDFPDARESHRTDLLALLLKYEHILVESPNRAETTNPEQRQPRDGVLAEQTVPSYGRTDKLKTLEECIVKDECHPVGLINMGGIDKRRLPAKLIVKKSQHDDVAGGHMETSVTVYDTGRLDAVTRTWTNVKASGLRGGVVVVLLDSSGHRLWASQLRTYGVDGKWIGRSDRTEPWDEHIPHEIIIRAVDCEIIHQHNPSDDWHRWIRKQLGL